MYQVSQECKDIIRGRNRVDRLTGYITFTDGTILHIEDSIIDNGSTSVTYQSIEGDEVAFGDCMSSELNIGIRSDIDRYKFFGAEISITYGIQVGDSWEDIPMGIFIITDATRTGSVVSISACDRLMLLDREFGATTLAGTPYNILVSICNTVGLTLKNTAAEFARLQNNDVQLQIDPTNNCSTFREAVKSIAQTVGCFATMTRTGELEIRAYSNNPNDTLTERHRYSAHIEDYKCHFSTLKITGLKGTFEASNPYTHGSVMEIADAIAWDYGDTIELEARVKRLLDWSLSVLDYTPCSVDMPSDPTIECGDWLNVSVKGDSVRTYAMRIEWVYRGVTHYECCGKNPYFNNTSTISNTGNRISNTKTEQNKVVMYNYTNDKDLVMHHALESEFNNHTEWERQENSPIELCSLRVTTSSSTYAMFHATVTLSQIWDTYDGKSGTSTYAIANHFKITYTLDNEKLSYCPIYSTGVYQRMPGLDDLAAQTITLFLPIDSLSEQMVHIFTVSIEPILDSGAGINSGAILIKRGDFKCTFTGQNLVETEYWDGKLDFRDNVGAVTTMLSSATITDIIPTVALHTPTSIDLEEQINNNTISLLPVSVAESEPYIDTSADYSVPVCGEGMYGSDNRLL